MNTIATPRDGEQVADQPLSVTVVVARHWDVARDAERHDRLPRNPLAHRGPIKIAMSVFPSPS